MPNVVATIRIADIDEFRLLMWELTQLRDDMRVGGSPFAERLENALERFARERKEGDAHEGEP